MGLEIVFLTLTTRQRSLFPFLPSGDYRVVRRTESDNRFKKYFEGNYRDSKYRRRSQPSLLFAVETGPFPGVRTVWVFNLSRNSDLIGTHTPMFPPGHFPGKSAKTSVMMPGGHLARPGFAW